MSFLIYETLGLHLQETILGLYKALLDLGIIMKSHICFSLLASFSLWNLYFYKCYNIISVYFFVFYSEYLLRFAIRKLWNLIFLGDKFLNWYLLGEGNKRIKFSWLTFRIVTWIYLTPYPSPSLSMSHLVSPYKQVFPNLYAFKLA